MLKRDFDNWPVPRARMDHRFKKQFGQKALSWDVLRATIVRAMAFRSDALRLFHAAPLFLVFLCAACLAAQTQAPSTSQPEEDGPHLEHHGKPLKGDGAPPAASSGFSGPAAEMPAGPQVAPGLHLSNSGNFWALDTFDGRPELVHMRYSSVTVNRHLGSNLFKTEAAPFFYKPKVTIEIDGHAAAIRLHSTTPTFYVRDLLFQDKADAASGASPGSERSHVALVRLKVQSKRRVASTMAFTQITGRASRYQRSVPISDRALPGTGGWRKITPRRPLAPGEYAIMPIYRSKYTFSTIAFDFAIDPKAPQNHEVIFQGNGPY